MATKKLKKKGKLNSLCTNHLFNDDCVKVKDKYDECVVCKKIWDEEIYINYCGENPHIPDMYKKAMEQFSSTYWDRKEEEMVSVKIKLIDTDYIYAYRNEPEWVYKFKVEKL